ncbi:MAG: hypothetical protein ACI8U3_002524 [Brevundimonas sp.]|jgi:hypothetical protein
MTDYLNAEFEALMSDTSESGSDFDAFDAQVAAGCTCSCSTVDVGEGVGN